MLHADGDWKMRNELRKRNCVVMYFGTSDILVLATIELRISFVWNELQCYILEKRNYTFWDMKLHSILEERNSRATRFTVVPLQVSRGKIMNVYEPPYSHRACPDHLNK
jgi:hypothetical protein